MPPTPGCLTFWSNYANNYGTDSRYILYIGYLYECLGWQVEYNGIVNGPLHDDGRDLICRKGVNVLIIQCKFSIPQMLNENLIYQLTGSSVEYRRTHPQVHVGSLFVTSASLSDRAKQAASVCGVVFREHIPFTPFPYAKCIVIGRYRTYYTPLQKNYLYETIRPRYGDMFCWDDTEAKSRGFN